MPRIELLNSVTSDGPNKKYNSNTIKNIITNLPLKIEKQESNDSNNMNLMQINNSHYVKRASKRGPSMMRDNVFRRLSRIAPVQSYSIKSARSREKEKSKR